MVAHRAGAFDWKLAVALSLSCAGIGVACSSSSDAPSGGGNAGATTAAGGGGSPGTGGSGTSGGSGGGTGGGATGGNGGSATGGASGNAGAGGTSGSGGSATGGSSGSGGSAGRGGTGGTSGGGDAGPASDSGPVAGGACPANAMFCSGFEDTLIPQGATYRPSYQMADAMKNMALDTSVVKFGKSSLRVNPGSAGYDWRMLSVPVSSPTFWSRVYIRSSIDIGQAEHNSYFQAMTSDGEPNVGDNVEVSEQYCQVVLNLHDEVVLSTGGATMCGSGATPLSKDTWHCMEAFFDGANGAVQVYADSKMLIDKSGWAKAKVAFKTFSFGYLGFHGPARTLWYDDVAVASQRIGCEP